MLRTVTNMYRQKTGETIASEQKLDLEVTLVVNVLQTSVHSLLFPPFGSAVLEPNLNGLMKKQSKC